LRRAYRTTLRLYRGQLGGGRLPAPEAAQLAAGRAQSARRPASVGLVARSIPGLSEPAAAVATASLRSLVRAPETKILLIGPLMALVVGISMLARHGTVPTALRPLLGFGAVAFILLTLTQLITNQFGFDRSGFRIWVLSPITRRDILLGKNLALVPVLAALAGPTLVLVQLVARAQLTQLIATIAAACTLFLLLCILGNLSSILMPLPVASGSLKPAHPKAGHILTQLGMVLLFPVLSCISLIPFGIQLLFHEGWPVLLVGSCLELALMITGYLAALRGQGRLLAARETQILAAVTENVE
jgi:hypothetical protein